VIAQIVERLLESDVRHREVALTRAGEEVGHIGVEPFVAATRPHSPNEPFEPMARQQPLDRTADAVVDRAIEREMLFARELVDVEQRQRAARGLFRAAVRIAVERLQQRRDVERGRGPNRELHAAGPGHQIGEQVARDR